MMLRVKNNYLSYISILILCLAISGGCDVDFGTSEDDSNGSNGSGDPTTETVEGTIVDTTPSRDNDVSNILVEVGLENDVAVFSDTTGSSGFFDVEGNFAGNTEIEFLDQDDNNSSLGIIFVTVFPSAIVKLGDLRLENGNVNFLDEVEVTFTGDVIENNCTDNNGSIIVEAKNDQTEVDVLVQITPSTDIESDGDEIECDNILIGQEVEVKGELLIGNSVDALEIDIEP